MTNRFDAIRPFYDSEVNTAIRSILEDPMLQSVMQFVFADKTAAEHKQILENLNSTQAFQIEVVYPALQKILAQSSAGLTHSGFDKLDKNKAYLYISNHRDILLDTSLLNVILFENQLVMTASCIGDNLVKMSTLNTLSKINRNILVQRGLSPRELLMSSKLLSEYIRELLTTEKRSVWIAQREGRTKDGIDATHTGVLKMLMMSAGKTDFVDFWRSMQVVPVSISYEQDPTDSLKIPELLANENNETYVKHASEDFNSIMRGLLGQKKRIHIHAGDVLDTELNQLNSADNSAQLIKNLAQIIDNQIVSNYKLRPSNYIALDILNNTNDYTAYYSEEEKAAFTTRMATKMPSAEPNSCRLFLQMYANPVLNKM
jgi:1-acyl-sn-glycerol-3-phosphate acyltransferase